MGQENIPSLRFSLFHDSWIKSKIKEIGKIKSGATPSRSKGAIYFTQTGGIPWLKTLDLTNGIIHSTSEALTELGLEETSCSLLPKGTVLIAMYGGFNQIGRTGLLNFDAAINQAISGITLDTKKIIPQFLLAYLNHNVKKWRRVAASSRKDPNITKADVENFVITHPSLLEQEKIANFLSDVDVKIENLAKQKECMQQYKKGCMQKLFSKEIRFKDDDGNAFPDWEEKTVGDILTESKIKGSTGDNARKLTVKLWRNGVFAKNEVRAGSENTQYYVRKKNQFIYSKLDFLNCAFGIIPEELDGYESTVDLPCFEISPLASPAFLLERISQKNFYKKFGEKADGSRKAKRIHAATFLEMPIQIPMLAEQEKITNFLSDIDEKIDSLDKQLEAIKEFKKGLLQGMFV
ncbi:restriction endonuclease subunit S [Halodesulfovibrio sp.]|jgi:type I restriction enzyme S subunit|uniref:restriction endonuclease subunit S n=1 Tax=Halodesulfovibrio sp. TaxID=1912772 RepID=UPI0025E498AE|nr:restriction endonuclease subunit S [Halodesulfovibrio sp.]MCT4627233.1 restriction endonuclease subunit S [Halodesulfovibrio sp.]